MSTRQRPNEDWALSVTTEPSDFTFDIVLGGTYDDRAGRTFSHGVDETKTCTVVISEQHGATPTRHRRPVFRRLEVLSPLTHEDPGDARREYELAWDCQQQLVFAFALFRPTPFVCVPWRERQRAAASFTENMYSLGAGDLPRFLAFARALLPFHTDRKRILFARVFARLPDDVSRDADVRALIGDTRPADGALLKNSTSVIFAADLFEETLRGQRAWLGHLSDGLQMVLLVAAAEALFSDGQSELSYRLSLRMATLNRDGSARKDTFDLVRRCYEFRSRVVHGAAYSESKGFADVDGNDLSALRNLVRSSLLYFIALRAHGKWDVLKRVDAAMFDAKDLHDLRREANRFWELGDSEEEQLHDANWRQL